MTKYIIKRLLMCVLVIISAAFVIFTIMYFVPGDPAKIMLGDGVPVEMIEAKREELGLNDPYLVRLGRFLSDTFLHFNLGNSYATGLPITVELMSRLPRTIALGVAGILVDALIAIPLGIIAGLKVGKWQSTVLSVGAMVLACLPDFWVALMLIILLSVKLNLLPSFGIGGIQYYIMPVIAISIGGIGGELRQTRSGMLDVMKSDFVTTARAKGVPERRVVLRHMLPNALIPVVTVIGASFARVIGGTVIIEQIFSIPGVGMYMLDAINTRDYPVIQGSVLILAAVTSLTMLLVDLIYALIDPRIKASYSKKGR